MVNRKSVSVPANVFNDGQRVDRDDLNVEQNRNVAIDASILDNHFGSGVLPNSLIQKVLFDSDDLTQDQAALIVSNDFDGTGLSPKAQPSDLILGNQLQVELTSSNISGRLSVKVLVIGLDFEGNTQYDRFEFFKNEIQVSKRHYTQILTVLFNDFKGNNNCSRANYGRVVISEAKSYQLSRDTVSVAQDFEPNIFFRDFKISGLISGSNPTISLYQTLQAGMGSVYTVDSLNIQTTSKQNRSIAAGDVVTKIGQKFKSQSGNIQKVSLLLGVTGDYSASIQDRFNWSGDLVISIFALQTSVSCPSSIIPELAIEFDPESEPLAQLSLDAQDFRSMGYILTDVMQPIDFVFSDTKIAKANNNFIVPDRYYAVTISRAGAANTGNILVATGNSIIENSRMTLFNSGWVDISEDSIWFRIYSDNAKVADGQAYDEGIGIQIDKTIVNDSAATIDYSFDNNEFFDTGESVLNTAIIQAVARQYQEEQDERTGNPVFSRQIFEPVFSFVNNSGLSQIKETSDPLIIGAARDTNPKRNPVITGIQNIPGLAKGNVFTLINPNADILSNNLLGSTLIPNSNSSFSYKITKVKRCVDGYGDVNGDGEINVLDITRASSLVGESVYLNSTQQKIINGEIDTLELLRADVDGDGYVTSNDVNLITDFVNRVSNSFPVGTSFTHAEIEVQQLIGRYDGYHSCGDGYVRIDGSSSNRVPASLLSQTELEYYGYFELPNIGADPAFEVVPFSSIDFTIQPVPFWQDYLVLVSSNARLVSGVFSSDASLVSESCNDVTDSSCQDQNDISTDVDPGRNDIYIPYNLILNEGQILKPDGSNYKVDLEINHIILQLPEVPLEEAVIDVFRKLVADSGNGFTTAGYPAMRFSDCSTVKSDALARGQVKFGVAVQAFNPNLDGYSVDDGYFVIVDDLIGVYMDQENGLLTLTIKDLNVDPIFLTMVTKIEITVFLKKGGWNNNTLVIPPEQIVGLLL